MIPNKRLRKYLKKAENLTNKCRHRSQHISFLVNKNKIVAIGTNSRKTDTFAFFNKYNYPSTHAELSAIKQACQSRRNKDCSNFVLINIRLLRLRSHENEILSACAAPCKFCLQLAKSVGVNKIYYTNGFGGFSVKFLN